MPSDFTSAALPAVQGSPAARYLSSLLNFGVTAGGGVTLGRQADLNLMALLKSAAQITPKSIPITIHLTSLLNFGVTADGGSPLAGGGAAGVRSSGLNKTSEPKNP